jgi:hypothetical protein
MSTLYIESFAVAPGCTKFGEVILHSKAHRLNVRLFYWFTLYNLID